MAAGRSQVVVPELKSPAVAIRSFDAGIAASMGPFHRFQSARHPVSFNRLDAGASENFQLRE